MSWSHFSHEADIGLRGAGKDKASAFAAIGSALTAVVTDPGLVEPSDEISVTCSAPTNEILLYDWLNKLIYEMAVRKMLYSEFDVSISGGELRAKIRGELVDREKHQPAVEVKGATYTALAVNEADGGWQVQCVVDV